MMLCVAAMAAIGAWAATWTDLKTGYTWTGIKIRFSYGRVTLIGRRRISKPRSLDREGPVPNGGVGARQSGGRRADLGAPVRRTDESGGASRGGRDQEPDSLKPVLPRANAGEGACRPNRPRAPELAASGI